jgi:hypothetical protein
MNYARKAVLAVGLMVMVPMSMAQTSRSEVGAIVSILSRLNADQGRSLIKGLGAVETAGRENKTSFSLPAAWDLLMQGVDGSDRQNIESIRGSAGSFDRESIAILVRDAYLSGVDDSGSMSQTLGRFSDANMMATGGKPAGTNRVVEHVIVDNLASKMSATSAGEFRRVVAALEKKAKTGYDNFGYKNAEAILVMELDADKRSTFVSEWKTWDIADREAILSIIRDAFLGGLEDL